MKRWLIGAAAFALIGGAALIVFTGSASAQYTPWLYWTLLPKVQMDLIVGESSGETALATIQDIASYMRDRQPEEWAGTLWESEAMMIRLKRYGFKNAELIKYPAGEAWDPVQGSLWEIKPGLRKLAAIEDNVTQLAANSPTTDVTAELVWVGRGTAAEVEAAKVEGKIAVTEGSMMQVYNLVCNQKGALGIVVVTPARGTNDLTQMGWAQVGGMRRPGGGQGGPGGARGGNPPGGNPPGGAPPAPPAAQASATPAPAPKFGFQLPVREGEILKQRLTANEKITVRVKIVADKVKYNTEVVTCSIPGSDQAAGEVIFSAHSFEGISKQGANDNTSGSAAILESARILKTLIDDGRLPQPKRTIRWLWGPEFAGTGKWVGEHKDIMSRTLCNINMDMVGEWLSKNQSFFCLMRTTYGNPHYINDVMENIYRYVGEGTRERLQNRSTAFKVPVRIVAPFGADEPFWYSIETHYGASDHEVFNDWGVGVPGIMMIAWPDRWYHTSGDTADKSDATQMKRAALIGAAGAYTVAAADDAQAIKLAGEIASNAARRIGHQMVVGLEALNGANAAGLVEAYKTARTYVEGAVINEKDTLDSVLELAGDKAAVGAYVGKMKTSVEAVGAAELAALQAHMEAAAKRLGAKPVVLQITDEEKKAAKIVPRPTAKVTAEGYGGYRKFINEVSAADKAKYAYAGEVSNPTELQLLVNGKHSVLEIRSLLDAQVTRKSTIKGIINCLTILKLAGLVEF
ncbi:MAG: M28 family peptidase [Acidobacteriota bacterium]|nr:M28 family peptidase [Acidobacteriota bacterium]